MQETRAQGGRPEFETVPEQVAMGSRINKADGDVPSNAAISGVDMVESQAHGRGTASPRSEGAAEELLGPADVFLKLVLDLGCETVSIEECPEQEIPDIIPFDIVGMCAQSPQAQVALWIGHVVQAALEKSLSVDIVWRVPG